MFLGGGFLRVGIPDQQIKSRTLIIKKRKPIEKQEEFYQEMQRTFTTDYIALNQGLLEDPNCRPDEKEKKLQGFSYSLSYLVLEL